MIKFSVLFFLPVCFFSWIVQVWGQNTSIKGRITDAETMEGLPGVNVIINDSNGTTSDKNGFYEILIKPGVHSISYRLLGYSFQRDSLEIKEGISYLNKQLIKDTRELNLIVVTAGKYEQKIEEVVVSMQVIKPSFGENTNATSMDQIIEQTPGISIIDGQANIRGGSGYSYGAGSRVLVLVDDLPLLSADAGDVKWNFLPIENLEQIEVIKGASSALFGSSALNGVINIRTAYPKDKPETKINFYNGIYNNPKRKELKWWNSAQPMYTGTNFFHSRKIKKLDFVGGGNIFNDNSYREGENEQRVRLNFNLRYRSEKIKGLNVGLNTNAMYSQAGLFLVWADDSAGAYRPLGGLDTSTTTLSNIITRRINLDPYIVYIDEKGNAYKLKGRYFKTTNINDTRQNSDANFGYGEFQYQKQFKFNLVFTTGITKSYSCVKSDFYGNHDASNTAVYGQLDQKWKNVTFSLGVRWEQFTLDTMVAMSNPFYRSGLNYCIFKSTYLRASFGQGYRLPSIAEKFIRTQAGNINIYPNPDLKPESGWSSEAGIRQGLKLGKWKGFFDAAAFWTQYQDMMEFSFGQWGNIYNDPMFGLGFKSLNIGNTRIRGVEISVAGERKFSGIQLNLIGGYTYIDPTQLDFNPQIDTLKNTANYNFLKYRYRHTAKVDVECSYKVLSTGISLRFNSFMENIDKVFEDQIPGVENYRKNHNTGDWVLDHRISFQIASNSKMALIVKNVLNREYMGRPADMQAPRSLAVQYSLYF